MLINSEGQSFRSFARLGARINSLLFFSRNFNHGVAAPIIARALIGFMIDVDVRSRTWSCPMLVEVYASASCVAMLRLILVRISACIVFLTPIAMR